MTTLTHTLLVLLVVGASWLLGRLMGVLAVFAALRERVDDETYNRILEVFDDD